MFGKDRRNAGGERGNRKIPMHRNVQKSAAVWYADAELTHTNVQEGALEIKDYKHNQQGN